MPTAEQYRRAREAAFRRQVALARSRPGVVDLAEWRAAVAARAALVRMFGLGGWRGQVRIAAAERGLVLRVRLVRRRGQAEVVLPEAVNDVKILMDQ